MCMCVCEGTGREITTDRFVHICYRNCEYQNVLETQEEIVYIYAYIKFELGTHANFLKDTF